MKPTRLAVMLTAALLIGTGSMAAAPAALALSSPDTLVQTYNNPTTNYLTNQAPCLINLSSISDFTIVPSVTQCGQTITFTAPPQKLSVPATWPIWGVPVQTEVPQPHVLYTLGQTSLSIRFSSPRRVAGFEATPQPGTVQSFKANYLDASGNLIGTVSRTIQAGKARLIAAKTQASTKVSEIQVTSNGDFAIAQLRIRP